MGARTPVDDAEALPALALSRPAEALRRAEAALAGAPEPLVASYAHQAAGIVLRDRGDTTGALRHLRCALEAAGRCAEPGRDPDVRATLGATLALAGRTAQGLTHLALASDAATGLLQARVLMRRAFVLGRLGRHDEALDDLRRAVGVFREHGDELWEARALTTRARTHLERGALGRAAEDTTRAETLFRSTGQELEAATALHNRGTLAYLSGDLPGALALLDEASRAFPGGEAFSADLAHDRCDVLLAAGLADDALRVADQALADGTPSAVVRAHLQLAAATAAFAVGDLEGALVRGRAARTSFTRQQREWWRLAADVLLLQVRDARGERGRRIAQEAAAVTRRLVALGAPEAPVALLLAARLADDPGEAAAHLSAAARYRRHPSALVATTGWLALALAREAAGEPRGVLSACGRGLDALDEHRTSLGSSELQALSTRHGRELATLALREAAASGSARRLLGWSERWRATALAQPPVRPPGDAADELGRLRLAVRQLDELRHDSAEGADVQREQRALEREVRDRRHRMAGRGEATARFDLPRLLADLAEHDGTTFVELVDVDGTLRAQVAHAGGCAASWSAPPTRPPVPSPRPASCCARPAAGGPPTSPGSARGWSARCSARLRGRSATDPWSSRLRGVCTRPPGACCPRSPSGR